MFVRVLNIPSKTDISSVSLKHLWQFRKKNLCEVIFFTDKFSDILTKCRFKVYVQKL